MKSEYISERRSDDVDKPVAFADRLAAEGSLLGSAPRVIANGVVARIEHLNEKPGELALLAGSGAALGVGLSVLARSRNLGSLATSVIPYAMGLAAATDIGIKVGVPMYNAWHTPFSVEEQKTLLGKNVGSLVVDYAAMGITGYAGARAITYMPRGALGQSAIGADLNGLTRAVRNGFERPSELSRHLFWSEGTNHALKTFQEGRYVEAPIAAYGAELNNTTRKLSAAVNEHLGRHGMPSANLEWKPLARADAQVVSGAGTVEFSARNLAKGRGSHIADLTAHELTHVEQETLTLRRLADKLSIGEKATVEQMAALKHEFQVVTEKVPTEEFIGRVLEFRNGRQLEPKQAARADRLIQDDVVSLANFHKQETLLTRNTDIHRAIEEVGRSGWSTAHELKRPDRLKHLLGDQPVTPELQASIDALTTQSFLARQTKFNPDRIRLRDALIKEANVTAGELRQCYNVYRNSLAEREAFTMGARAGWQYLLNGRLTAPLLGLGIAGTINNMRTVSGAFLPEADNRVD